MVKKAICATQMLFVCLAAFVVIAADDYAVVTKDFAKVMQSPYGDAPQVGLAKKGDHYKIRYQQGEWFCIENNGIVGWMYSANISVEHNTASSSKNPKPVSAPSAPDVSASPNKTVAEQKAEVPAQTSATSGEKSPSTPPPEEASGGLNKTVSTPKKDASFSISEAKQKKKASQKTIPPVVIKAGPVDNLTPEIIAVADSLQKSRANKPASGPDSLSQGKPAAPTPAQRYFEVMESPTKILKNLSPQSPLILLAAKNDIFPLVYAGASWCKITVKNDTGWAETSHGRIIDSPNVVSTKIPEFIIIVLLAAGSSLVLIFAIIFVVLNLRRQKFKKHSLKRDVLIISRNHKEIHYSLTDITTTLPKCFSEIGFKVNLANDLEHAGTLLAHYAPDVIVADWELGPNIQSAVGSVVLDKSSGPSRIVIFFNVPDPTETSRKNKTPNVFFLGLVFSDRDIFKIVTPLIMSASSSRTIKKSVQTSALEGDIRLGNLMEVMQFIEIGKKTGCLYITVKTPFGLIYFEQGRLTYAATQGAQGKEAVFEILNLKEGHFHLVLDKTTPSKNVNLSTLEVLMDWTKVKDEALRG
jgi:uncharacterized protein YraI